MRKEGDSLELLAVGFGFGWGARDFYRRGGSSLNQITKSNSNSANSGYVLIKTQDMIKAQDMS